MSRSALSALPLRRLYKDQTFPDTGYPFNVAALQHLNSLTFEHPVTFFAGENGSGKSTLLEAIACAAELPTIGEYAAHRDPTLRPALQLADALRWEWNRRQRRGFFMRSEDFFGYVKQLEQTKRNLQADLHQTDKDNAHRGRLAQSLARMSYASQLHALKESYGDGLDARSHGESFLHLFRSRFVDRGLYLMDEPEAPLSPMRQLSLIAMIADMTRQGAQFVIATHSPILLAYPGATLYQFANESIAPVMYEALEHVQITRDFLNNPSQYLRHLISDPDEPVS